MAITPIDAQTNLAKNVDVDRMRQQQHQHMLGEQKYGEEIAEKVGREDRDVQQTESSEKEKNIDDYDSEKKKKERESKRSSLETREESGEEEKKKSKDPNKGKLIDITL